MVHWANEFSTETCNSTKVTILQQTADNSVKKLEKQKEIHLKKRQQQKFTVLGEKVDIIQNVKFYNCFNFTSKTWDFSSWYFSQNFYNFKLKSCWF